MKIRVLHIITKLELGGAQINTIYTYEHLDRDRFNCYLLSGDGGILNRTIVDRDHFFIEKKLVRPIRPIGDLIALFRLKKRIRSISPDIVHTHSSKAGIIGRVASKLAKVPVTIHSVHGFSFSPNQSLLKQKIFQGIERFISRFTDHFIFVSKNDLETAKQLNLVRDNSSLIRSGFPQGAFKEDNKQISALKRQYNIPADHQVIGIIAPFKPQKGLFHLIRIAEIILKRNDRIRFIIAGDGVLRDQLESELTERNIRSHFILPGFLTESADVAQFISICDIGVSTAMWEGLPQSLVQFRLKRKAVVVSDIPGNTEIIHDGRNGYCVNVNEYDRFADRILTLLGDADLRKKMSEFDDDFSKWDADYMVDRQAELYEDLLKFNKI